MDRLYPVFHFELPMLASSEQTGQRGVELSVRGRQGALRWVPRWREGTTVKL